MFDILFSMEDFEKWSMNTGPLCGAPVILTRFSNPAGNTINTQGKCGPADCLKMGKINLIVSENTHTRFNSQFYTVIVRS